MLSSCRGERNSWERVAFGPVPPLRDCWPLVWAVCQATAVRWEGNDDSPLRCPSWDPSSPRPPKGQKGQCLVPPVWPCCVGSASEPRPKPFCGCGRARAPCPRLWESRGWLLNRRGGRSRVPTGQEPTPWALLSWFTLASPPCQQILTPPRRNEEGVSLWTWGLGLPPSSLLCGF